MKINARQSVSAGEVLRFGLGGAVVAEDGGDDDDVSLQTIQFELRTVKMSSTRDYGRRVPEAGGGGVVHTQHQYILR